MKVMLPKLTGKRRLICDSAQDKKKKKTRTALLVLKFILFQNVKSLNGLYLPNQRACLERCNYSNKTRANPAKKGLLDLQLPRVIN